METGIIPSPCVDDEQDCYAGVIPRELLSRLCILLCVRHERPFHENRSSDFGFGRTHQGSEKPLSPHETRPGTHLGGYAIMIDGTGGAHLNSFSLADMLSHGRASP